MRVRARFNQTVLMGLAALLLSVGLVATADVNPAQAQTYAPCCDTERGTLSTSGSSEVTAQPDSLRVNVQVEARDKTLADAQASANKRMEDILKNLRALNLPNMTLKTVNANITPIREEYKNNKLQPIIGYRVTNGIEVTLTRLNPLELGSKGASIIDKATAAGADQVSGIQFYLDNVEAYQQKALAEAVANARANADAMARAAGVRIVGVHSLNGSPSYHRPMPMYARMDMAAEGAMAKAPATPVEVGDMTIQSQVSVKFRVE